MRAFPEIRDHISRPRNGACRCRTPNVCESEVRPIRRRSPLVTSNAKPFGCPMTVPVGRTYRKSGSQRSVGTMAFTDRVGTVIGAEVYHFTNLLVSPQCFMLRFSVLGHNQSSPDGETWPIKRYVSSKSHTFVSSVTGKYELGA